MPESPTELKTNLIRHLNEANLPNPIASLKWLAFHLDEYLGQTAYEQFKDALESFKE
jgi:hypothetical protein